MGDITRDPFGKFNGHEAEYVLRALDSEGDDTPWVQQLEEAFAAKVGARFAIAVNSGTSGLHAALFAAGVKPGDEVIVPAMSVVMDAYAAIHLGAVPVFVDIVPETQHLDPDEVSRHLSSRTKAIITVSWQGLPVDMDPIMALAREHGLVVVDDSAQTMMARYKGVIAGSNAHIGVFSFEDKKHLTTGSEGGMIVCDDEEMATRARKFAGIGYKHMAASGGATHLATATVQDPAYERFDTIGLNYRMSRVQAAVGLAQFERVDQIVARRRAVAELFHEAIERCAWMRPQHVPEHSLHTYYTFAVDYLGAAVHGVPWKAFYHRYLEKGGDGFYACCAIPYLEPSLRGRRFGDVTFAPGLCPAAEALQPRLMQFKTNYRDPAVARRKAQVLAELIDEMGR